jgi:hypothetical protein
MSEELPIDTRTEEERAESYRHWAKQGPAAIFAATLRMSIEHYGMPIGDICDGPVRKYIRNADGTETVIAEWSGPNPLRHE